METKCWPKGKNNVPLWDRLHDFDVMPNNCWVPRRRLTTRGYTRIRVGGVDRAMHQVAYELYRGIYDRSLDLDHLCRRRACINPWHLEAVTHKENCQRGEVGAYNKLKTHCLRGHEYNEENTYRCKKGRQCKECARLRKRGEV